MSKADIAKAIAVTAEIIGTELSDIAIEVFLHDLEGYPEMDIMKALTQCRKEDVRRLTSGAVLQRLAAMDGRLGPEEAWMLVTNRERPHFYNSELNEAYALVKHFDLNRGDSDILIPARMAFVEKYRKVLAEARLNAQPVEMLFHHGRLAPLEAAKMLLSEIEKGRLKPSTAAGCLHGLKSGNRPHPKPPRTEDERENDDAKNREEYARLAETHIGFPPRRIETDDEKKQRWSRFWESENDEYRKAQWEEKRWLEQTEIYERLQRIIDADTPTTIAEVLDAATARKELTP